MKSGIVGIVHGEFDEIENETDSINHEGEELKRCIDVTQSLTLDSGRKIQIGNIAREQTVKTDQAQISGNTIETLSQREIITEHTQFAAIPGELLVVGSGGNNFAFDMVGRQVETLIEPAQIDLDNFVADYDSASYWQYGFNNTGLNAENGILYGTEVQEDSTTQSFINSATANQIGVDFLYGDKPVKMRLARSGYIEVYQPSDWETTEYLDFLADAILPYIGSP